MTDKTQEAALAQRLRDCLTPTEREISDAAGYGKRIGFGSRPAILLVDATYSFCGREPKPMTRDIAEPVKSWLLEKGAPAYWDGAVRLLLDRAPGVLS